MIATGSSLLFMYDFAERMLVHTEAPVKVVRQTVRTCPWCSASRSRPALSKPENCADDYPFFARMLGHEGMTELAFTVGADGTVSGIKIAKSSGYDGLDDAAKDCVRKWHYRPALKDNVLVDAPMTVKVKWNLDDGDATRSRTRRMIRAGANVGPMSSGRLARGCQAGSACRSSPASDISA